MARHFTVARKETFSAIARRRLGTPALGAKLADFNGMSGGQKIRPGQTLELPSLRELRAEHLTTTRTSSRHRGIEPALLVPVPSGYKEIVGTFGDIRSNLDHDGNLLASWISQNIGRAKIPFPLVLSWNHAQRITSVQCHVKLVPVVEAAFRAIDTAGLSSKVRSYGGCFAFRQKRTSSKLSTHSWGIAIDLNTETNALGTTGDMNPGVIEVLGSFGFMWGGKFSGTKDPMHFQYCTGY